MSGAAGTVKSNKSAGITISRFAVIRPTSTVGSATLNAVMAKSAVTAQGAGTATTVQTLDSCTSRPDVCQCLVAQSPMDSMSKTKTSISMTHVACRSKLRPIVRSSVHPRPGNRVAIRSTVVYYSRAAHAFSAGIKCRHCT